MAAAWWRSPSAGRSNDLTPRRRPMEQVASGYGLIEGPVWDRLHGLYFSDVINGGVFCLDRAGKILPVVPKPRGIGGMALHQSCRLGVGGRHLDCLPLKDGTS